ncbi:MAG: MBL fold metallo-hydrolase, partial [Anaerolineae bacterium]
MKVTESCYAVTGLGAVPPWAVNAGIIVGSSKTLIIDTGANALAAQTIYGYATAIRPENKLIVFNCEPHFDHIGGNSFFQGLDIDIFGHPDIQ